MPYEHEGWVMRPVVYGLCLYESLKNGTLSIEDVLKMNDALDVKEENERRYCEAQNKKG